MLRRVAAFGVDAGPTRHPAGSRTGTPRRSTPSPGARARRPTPSGTRSARLEFLVRELDNPRPLIPAGSRRAPPRCATCSTRSSAIAAHPSRVARRLRHHDDAAGVGRPRRRAAAEGVRASPRPLRVVPLFETAADLQRRRAVLDRLLRIDAVSRSGSTAARRSWSATPIRPRTSGGSPPAWELYKAQEAIVAACRRHGVARHAVSRPRRQRRPRRRARPIMALQSQPSGLDRRHAARHRAGRDDPGAVRPAGHRRCARWRSTRAGRSSRGCVAGAAAAARVARVHGAAARRRAARCIAATFTSDPRVPRVLPRATPLAELEESTSAAVRRARKRAGGVADAARDSVAVRLDADAPDARRRGSASRRRWSAPSSAARATAPRDVSGAGRTSGR